VAFVAEHLNRSFRPFRSAFCYYVGLKAPRACICSQDSAPTDLGYILWELAQVPSFGLAARLKFYTMQLPVSSVFTVQPIDRRSAIMHHCGLITPCA
jgi:hypothetical protein